MTIRRVEGAQSGGKKKSRTSWKVDKYNEIHPITSKFDMFTHRYTHEMRKDDVRFTRREEHKISGKNEIKDLDPDQDN